METASSSDKLPSALALLGKTLRTYKKHFRSLGVLLLLILPTTLFPAIYATLAHTVFLTQPTLARWEQLTYATIFILLLFFAVWGTISTIKYLQDTNIPLRYVLKTSLRKLPAALWIIILFAIQGAGIVGIGAVIALEIHMTSAFVFTLAPLLLLSVWSIFMLHTLVYENKHGLRALIRSRKYTKGSWWSLFEYVLVLCIIFSLPILLAKAMNTLPSFTGNLTYMWAQITLIALASAGALSLALTYISEAFSHIRKITPLPIISNGDTRDYAIYMTGTLIGYGVVYFILVFQFSIFVHKLVYGH